MSFYGQSQPNVGVFTEKDTLTMYSSIRFDANKDEEKYGNNMSNHANGDDIHPYLIKVLYLISY